MPGNDDIGCKPLICRRGAAGTEAAKGGSRRSAAEPSPTTWRYRDDNEDRLGYGFDVGGLDLGLALIIADDAAPGNTDETLVFSIGKTFRLR